MIEIPEAHTLARQITTILSGKVVQSVVAASSPHKFAWYFGDPARYPDTLNDNSILSSSAVGGMVEVKTSHATLLFHDGATLRYLAPSADLPQKHQLLIQFTDGSALVSSVQMYGGLYCWPDTTEFDYVYYQVARKKPSPLNGSFFTPDYFHNLLAPEDVQKLSLKAALATQQRIPGLGNGVLQDILWKAGFSPKRKANTLKDSDIETLFISIRETLNEMIALGGRDPEKDLFDAPGGYRVVMSAKKNGLPCPKCGTPIKKEAYLGGSIYYCSTCQPS